MSETTARADLLDLLAQWFLTTGKGSREHADRILNKHAHELAERLRNVHPRCVCRSHRPRGHLTRGEAMAVLDR